MLARVAHVSDCKFLELMNLKILNPKKTLQSLPVALAKVQAGKVQAGNTSKNLLNEIRQMIYSLYRAKEITKM